MTWRGLASRPKGARRNDQAHRRLVKAYKEVFRPSESVDIVLADLANYCGFYKVAPPGTPAEALFYEQGTRAAFGRLFHFLSLPDDRLEDLEKAAQAESLADGEEGQF